MPESTILSNDSLPATQNPQADVQTNLQPNSSVGQELQPNQNSNTDAQPTLLQEQVSQLTVQSSGTRQEAGAVLGSSTSSFPIAVVLIVIAAASLLLFARTLVKDTAKR